MSSKICSEVYKGNGDPDRHCVLDEYHVGCCKDETGFKFTVEHLAFDHKVYWPNHIGNGPSGYPMNNEGFDKAVKKVLDARKEDLEQVEEFMRKMDHASRGK